MPSGRDVDVIDELEPGRRAVAPVEIQNHMYAPCITIQEVIFMCDPHRLDVIKIDYQRGAPPCKADLETLIVHKDTVGIYRRRDQQGDEYS